ncbi:hypothetical protein ACFSJ0_55610, partial [Nonomuraea guangzhouensis]
HHRLPRRHAELGNGVLKVEERIADDIIAQILANPAKGIAMTLPGELARQRVPSVHVPTWDDVLADSPWLRAEA